MPKILSVRLSAFKGQAGKGVKQPRLVPANGVVDELHLVGAEDFA